MIQRNWTLSNALVNTSAKFCFVSIFLRIISPRSTCSLTKWYLVSICLHLGKFSWFLTKCIRDWLSSRIVSVLTNLRPSLSVSSEISEGLLSSALSQSSHWISQLVIPHSKCPDMYSRYWLYSPLEVASCRTRLCTPALISIIALVFFFALLGTPKH